MKSPVVAFAVSMILLSAPAAIAQTGVGPAACVIWHRFAPGPIVHGHRRQPTLGEVESRLQELQALRKRNADTCATVLLNGKTIAQGSPGAGSTDQVAVSDSSSLSGTQ
jgi:hypothetical protein